MVDIRNSKKKKKIVFIFCNGDRRRYDKLYRIHSRADAHQKIIRRRKRDTQDHAPKEDEARPSYCGAIRLYLKQTPNIYSRGSSVVAALVEDVLLHGAFALGADNMVLYLPRVLG